MRAFCEHGPVLSPARKNRQCHLGAWRSGLWLPYCTTQVSSTKPKQTWQVWAQWKEKKRIKHFLWSSMQACKISCAAKTRAIVAWLVQTQNNNNFPNLTYLCRNTVNNVQRNVAKQDVWLFYIWYSCCASFFVNSATLHQLFCFQFRKQKGLTWFKFQSPRPSWEQ